MSAGPNDLTTLASAKAWISTSIGVTTVDDAVLQEAIAAASQYFLNKVGRPNMSTVQTYTQNYNGNGNARLFPLQDPIISVTSLSVSRVSVAASSGWPSPGYLIAPDFKSIYLLGNLFCRGIQNVALAYTAGFTAVPQDVATSTEMLIAQIYQRRQNVDKSSIALSQGGGTTSFKSWEADPFVMKTIQYWTMLHR